MAKSKRGSRVVGKAAAVEAKGKGQVLTVGELVAAAFDTVGTEVRQVARLLSSREMHQVLRRRIEVV